MLYTLPILSSYFCNFRARFNKVFFAVNDIAENLKWKCLKIVELFSGIEEAFSAKFPLIFLQHLHFHQINQKIDEFLLKTEEIE